MTTPNGGQIFYRPEYSDDPDTLEDVTEAVQALYDLVISSMDWGSGLLCVEDCIPVVELGKLCGFKGIEEAEAQVNAWRNLQEEQEARKAAEEAAYENWLKEEAKWTSPKGGELR